MTASNSRRILIVVAISLIIGTAGIHKVMGPIPPDWFMAKFENSLLGIVPFGREVSYISILLMELLIPLFMAIGVIKLEIVNLQFNFIRKGFSVSYVLFIILAFGSFLVQDYENGFIDFIYLAALLLLEKAFFTDSNSRT